MRILLAIIAISIIIIMVRRIIRSAVEEYRGEVEIIPPEKQRRRRTNTAVVEDEDK